MANNIYVNKPGTNKSTPQNTVTPPVANNVNTPVKKVKDKRNGFLNIIIIVLTVILFFLAVTFIAQTAPRANNYYTESSAEDLIRRMNYSGYQRMLESVYENRILGVTEDKKPELTVPYAIADYYEAAFLYEGYTKAGVSGTDKYLQTMNEAKGKMGDYSYIADEIDEYFGIK